MIDDRYFLEFAHYQRDLAEIRRVRTQVFIVEQAVPEDLEWDDDDIRCDHVLARDREGAAIATGRVSPEGKIGRMAVLENWRGQGVGAAVLRNLIERARERGMREVHLNAQVRAMRFYQAAGFRPFGEEFDEAGIAHMAMTRVIAAPEILKSPRQQRSADPFVPLKTETAGELASATRAVVAAARRELRIYSRNLDRAVLDDSETIEALKHFAITHRPRNVMRILVQDPSEAVSLGHRLIALHRQLSSIIAMRVPAADDLRYASAFVVNEDGGYLFREVGDQFNGHGDLADPVESARLRRYFDQVWERASEHPDLRRLGL